MSATLDSFLQELQAEDSTDAPFNLGQTEQKNRLVFTKVKAKNFRSIGQEFMELDFIKNKTTLIVSDDNGSGKSTLSVWAPYFALTGKPYSKKEKIGALVNSQIRKDLLVELYLSTRGVDYKVVRGYKPAVFDIYKKEGGSWVKFDAPPSTSQQQSNLEMLLGFDAKIIEKTMILGLDKFEPFIDLDAATRRTLIEKIWDLSVFSVMLDEAKKRFSISKRIAETTSIEIDKKQDSLEAQNKNIQIAEGFKEDQEVAQKELEELTKEIPELELVIEQDRAKLETTINNLLAERQTLDEKHVTIKRSVMEKHKAEGIRLQTELKEMETKAEEMVSNAEAEFTGERQKILDEYEALKETCSNELADFDSSIAPQREQIKQDLEQSEETAKLEGSKFLEQEKEKEVPWATEKLGLEKLEDLVKILNDEMVSAKENKSYKENDLLEFRDSVSKVESSIGLFTSSIQNINTRLDEFSAAKQKLADTGNCPHCLQQIGEAALELYTNSIAEEVQRLEENKASIKAQLESAKDELSKLQEKITLVEKDIKLLTAEIEDCVREIQNNGQVINNIKLKISELKSDYSNKIKNKHDEIIRQYTEKAKEALTNFDNNTKTQRLELTTKHNELIGKLEQQLATLKSKIDTSVAQAKQKASEASSAAKVNYDTWQANAAADLKENLSEITAQRNSNIKSEAETEEHYDNLISNNVNKLERLRVSKVNKEKTVKSLEDRINNTIKESETEIEILNEKLKELGTEHQNLTTKMNVTMYLINELGDSAAKTEIIRQYIPFLNAKINEYMGAMNLFVGFSMDEKFEVSFTSPDRKTQTVHSLSNGQKTRMNLAILFALRDVANLKNTTDSNLLVLDELLEPISEQGIREVVEMLRNKFSNSNVVVVTQRKKEFVEYFDNTITYGLRGGFTTVIDE